MIRVIIIAKYSEIREGLSTVLGLAGDIEVIASAASLGDAIRQAGAPGPDVFLIDMEMPGGEGYETIRQAAREYPAAKAIALTSHDYPAARESAIQAGADGVLVKGLPVQEMVAAIQGAE